MKSEKQLYVAFLRGINVGGRKVIRMEELQKLFEGTGCSEVKTLLQSGNVIFSFQEQEIDIIAPSIEQHLEKELGYRVEIMLRTLEELASMVRSDPFNGRKETEDMKLYVSFLLSEPDRKIPVPYISEKDGIEVISASAREAFIISRRIMGRSSFPNQWIEKELKVPATTRNWNTIARIVKG